MIQDSILLLNKLDRIYNKYSKHIRRVSFSKEGESFLTHLFSELNKYEKQYHLEKKGFTKTVIEHLPKSSDYNYIHGSLRETIEKTCPKKIQYTFALENRNYSVFMCCPSNMSNDCIESRLKKMYMFLRIVNPYVSRSCSNSVHVYLYFIATKKMLPTLSSDPIDQIHVNTAFTTTCQPHTNVHVFREEEWFRAFVHESFHNLGLDFILIDDKLKSQMENRIKEIFKIKIADIRFYETYCEMWGELFNNMFVCHMNHKSLNAKMKSLREILMYEQLFSFMQCVKILNHNKLKYEQLYLEHYAKQYNEKTQGFSYYILKCILMSHVSQFIDFCALQHKDHSGYHYSVNFRKNMNTLTKYTQLIVNNHDSVTMNNGISIMEKELGKMKGFAKDTLRMSLIQLDC